MSGSRKYKRPEILRPIVLIGMMGAGKTTIGRLLAKRLALPFVDADDEIEKAAGMSISELFQEHGEESFRAGETKVIDRLLDGEPKVIATGGGAVTNSATRARIREKAISIWLSADIDTLFERVSRKSTRPLLQTPDPRGVLETLMREREPYYREADIIIESGGGAHEACVDAILAAIATAEDEARKEGGR